MTTTYGIATGLRGFSVTSLRVRIQRREGSYVWCMTADLCDSGTPLVLDASQVRPEANGEPITLRHKRGIVTFG